GPADGENRPVVRERQQKEQTDEKARHGVEKQRDAGDGRLQARALLGGHAQAQGDADKDVQNKGRSQKHQRVGQTGQELLEDRLAIVEGAAEVKGKHAFQVQYVLDRQRLVQSVLFQKQLPHFRRKVG